MKQIQVILKAEETDLIVSALNALQENQLNHFHPITRKIFISIRNDLEPRINKYKRKERYRLRILQHEARVIEFALSRYADLFPDNEQLYIASCCRSLLTRIQPQIL